MGGLVLRERRCGSSRATSDSWDSAEMMGDSPVRHGDGLLDLFASGQYKGLKWARDGNCCQGEADLCHLRIVRIFVR